MSLLRLTQLASLSILLAACSAQSDDPAVTARPDGAAPGTPAAAPAPVNTEAEVTNGTSTLGMKPGHVFACEGRDRTVSTITWRTADPAAVRIAIKVQAPGDAEAKVFTVGGSEGTAETENWVTAGVRVSMVDDATGAELASHTVTALPCR